MRRNLTLLLVLLALLAVGGLAAANNFDVSRMLFKGTYVPNVTTKLSVPGLDNAPAALVLMGGVLAGLAVVFGMGVALGQGAFRANKAEAAFKAKEGPAAPAAKSAPAAKPAEPAIPLSSTRGLAIFWVVTALVVTAFMAVRFYKDLGHVYMPNPAAELFDIPGEPVKNLPAFIPGPGGTMTAGWAFPAIMLVSLAVAGGAGFGLARLFAVLDKQVKTADQLPRTAIDKFIADMEARLNDALTPKPAGTPGNLFDQALIGLDVLLVLVILVIIAVWVAPSFTGVRAVDDAVKATQAAALWTPTPLPGPSPTPGPSPDEAFAALPAGDAASGQTLAASQGCEACHVTQTIVDGNPVPLVGSPWLASASPEGVGIGARAQSRPTAADYSGRATSAEGYLLESLIDPNAYLVSGYQPNLMPAAFATLLNDQQKADLIAYLLTLK